MSLRALLIGTSAVACLYSDRAAAQRPIHIPSRPECSDCRVQNVRLARLGSETGMGFVDLPAGVAQFADMWVVAHAAKPGSISLYDSNGKFVRDVGRPGKGPGEFQYASRIRAVGDSLLVYDATLNRMQVFSSSFEAKRTFVVEGPLYRFDVLPDGRLAVEGYSWVRSSNGMPLHIVSRDGAVERSFGADKRTSFSTREHLRPITVAPDGTIWTGRYREYVIEQWDASGKKLAEFRGNVPWFQASATRISVSPNTPPVPSMSAIWFDDMGRLWVAIAVPDENWKNAVRPSPTGRYNSFMVTDENDYRDTIYEIIDINTRKLIARARMPYWTSPASSRGLVVTTGESSDGGITIDIWRPQLQFPSR